jgi:hypothetical protein
LTPVELLDSKRLGIAFHFNGLVDSQQFGVTIRFYITPSEPYNNFRHNVVSSVEVDGVSDLELRVDIERSIERLASYHADWTHKGLQGTSALYYSTHLFGCWILRIANAFYTNGKSIFFEYDGLNFKTFASKLP